MNQKQDTNTSIRDKAIKWWATLDVKQVNNYRKTFFEKPYELINAEMIEEIYLSENSTPVNDNGGEGKEEFTGGEWEIERKGSKAYIVSNNPSCTYIAAVNLYDNIITNPIGEANARLIASAPAMYKALKGFIKEVQAQYGKVYVPNSLFDKVEEAKEILNRINKH